MASSIISEPVTPPQDRPWDLLDTQLNLYIIVALIITSILVRRLLASLHRRRLARKLECRTSGPRYPHKEPFFGLDYILENARNIYAFQFAKGVHERFQKLGSTYFAQVTFQRVIHTVDPENYEAIMKTRFDDYIVLPHRSKLVRLLLGPGVFSHNGEEWKKSRSLVRWSMGNLNIDTNILEEHVSVLIEKLRTQSAAYPDKAIDFTHLATAYTFNVAARLIFGSLADEPITESSHFAADFTNVSKIGQAMTVFILQGAHFFFRNRIAPAQKRLFDFVDTCVSRALATPKTARRKHDSIVEGLAAQTADAKRIRSEALNLFLAGHDTVKIAFTEQFWHLTRTPEAWRLLRAEVKEKLGDERPTLSQLREMIYLKWVINEANRLNPTLSAHGRKAIRDTVLPRGGGPDGSEPLLIEKGTYIAYSNYSLHRNPAVFGEDIETFRPDRRASINPGRFEYLDFGAGPRFCPGKEVGWATVAYATVRLAQEFETLSPPLDDLPWQEAPSFSFYNKNGWQVHEHQRLLVCQ